MSEVDIKKRVFEDRNNSLYPIIKRLEYNGFYLYMILDYYDECGCRSRCCDQAGKRTLFSARLKIRVVKTEKLVLTKKHTTGVKLSKKEDISEIELIDIANRNYEIL